jgi:signal transduction histidine kinase
LLTGQVGAALANARAYGAERKRAEALAEMDRVKTTFFSNVSHEFSHAADTDVGPLKRFFCRSTGPETRELITLAHRNSLRLLKLVTSLLDFSRIEAGRVEPTMSRSI